MFPVHLLGSQLTPTICSHTNCYQMADSDLPTRSFMDDANIKWANGVPEYTKVNMEYMKGRTRLHGAESVEKLVENLVKTFEMELVHKVNSSQWQTIDQSANFYIQTNGGRKIELKPLAELGNYKAFMLEAALFDNKAVGKDESFDMFHSAFPGGFAWELLDILSGPPTVAFTWRHWGKFDGPFVNRCPSGKIIELYGCAVAKVNDDLKLQSVEFYFDPNELIVKLAKFDIHDWSECPFHKN